MSIKETIQQDRIAALKAGNRELKGLLDYILGEIQKAEKAPNAKGDHETAVITAYIKSQRDNITEYTTSKPEEAERLQREIDTLLKYLPKQLTDDEIRAEIKALIEQGTTSRGMIMAALKQKHGAAIDGRRASELAAELAAG